MMVSRRDLLAGAASLGLAAGLGSTALPSYGPFGRKFRFIHLTDLHIQPELGAADGVAMAVQKINSLRTRPDFIITGGDHVMDCLTAAPPRANLQFNILIEALKPLEMPVYATIGNHDVYGWSSSRHVTEKDPEYGKQLFVDEFAKAPLYRSFDHLGWHFIILDCIQTKGFNWKLAIDDTQLTWLKADLERVQMRPTVVTLHAPVLTAFMQYWQGTTVRIGDNLILHNGRELQALFAQHNVRVVLQGHTHVVEEVEYCGTKYITGGSISGEWWTGKRLGVHPEGFMIYDVCGDLIHKHYIPYGWVARK